MNLTKKQQQMQDAILLAVHDTDSIEEAREKEFTKGCVIEMYYSLSGWYTGEFISMTESNIYFYIKSHKKKTPLKLPGTNIKQIIGKPPTLARVLTTLGKYVHGFAQNSIYKLVGLQHVCDRQLLNEDGTDATLFDQSQETQDAIYNLIVK